MLQDLQDIILRKEEGETGESYLIGHAEYPEMEEQLQSEFRELRQKGLKITSVVIYYSWNPSQLIGRRI